MATPQHILTIDDQVNPADQSQMDIKVETDKFGKTIKYMMFRGRHYLPAYDMSILEQIQNVSMRPEDIYFPAFPRTGTHWVYEMANMLLRGKAETIQQYKGKHQLEFATNDALSSLPSPRVINTHFRLSDAPREVKEKKCKIIYNLRDPKDVAVSLYHTYIDLKVSECECSFEGFLYLFLEGKVEDGGIFDHLLAAEELFKENPDIPVYIHIYEDTQQSPLLAVQRLSDFLGLSRDNDLCQAIADKCQISNMRRDKEKYSLKADGKSSLYRKGTVGDWKNYFTDQMLEDYYRVYEEKMAGSRFFSLYARNT
ncbi:sulfotransferase 1B1-like [Haliotis rufescens]|uniref:sulfotransferase 1B1-like n=1 Tax=Haliotis rufescens TaxID=6454 RepID=UPI00201F1E13|nr:sulfotransferase 1B1-like [Haliotis rufescens]